MGSSHDLIDDFEYLSYRANRDYDRYKEPFSTEPNPDYDFEQSRLKWRRAWTEIAKWPEEKLDAFERRYYNETGGK